MWWNEKKKKQEVFLLGQWKRWRFKGEDEELEIWEAEIWEAEEEESDEE
jgi:hypothetical protein